MPDEIKSLLLLLAIIFGSVAVFFGVLVWWFNRELDKLFDNDWRAND